MFIFTTQCRLAGSGKGARHIVPAPTTQQTARPLSGGSRPFEGNIQGCSLGRWSPLTMAKDFFGGPCACSLGWPALSKSARTIMFRGTAPYVKTDGGGHFNFKRPRFGSFVYFVSVVFLLKIFFVIAVTQGM